MSAYTLGVYVGQLIMIGFIGFMAYNVFKSMKK